MDRIVNISVVKKPVKKKAKGRLAKKRYGGTVKKKTKLENIMSFQSALNAHTSDWVSRMAAQAATAMEKINMAEKTPFTPASKRIAAKSAKHLVDSVKAAGNIAACQSLVQHLQQEKVKVYL